MSSRRTLNQGGGSSNPATKFLEWKSNDKCFAYYDKEAKENVKITLPFKFQFLEHFHTVKGWNDASESRIYSNEVKFISKEPLNVKSFKGGDIAEGIYSEIRAKIRDAGGKYYRSVYVLDAEGNIINLQIKGAVVSAYSDFCQNNKNEATKFESNWIEIKDFKELKKGATKYSVPVFSIGEKFTQSEYKLADENYKVIADYYNGYTSNEEEIEEEVDDLPF